MNRCSRFHLINVVWGKIYTKFFLDLCLPTQLSPGNVPAFRNLERAVYKIYTTAQDAETIIKHPSYSVLSDTIDTQIKIFNFPDEYLKNYKHTAMNSCHQHAVVEANKDNCGLVFLIPDGAYADGSLNKLIDLSKAGKRAVMLSTYRINKETFVPEFVELFNPHSLPTISVSTRELVRLSLKHLHPVTEALFWKSTGSKSAWPSINIWRVSNEEILIRQFHLHPLMVIPSRKDVLPSPTIDGKYISMGCSNLDEVYIVEDSDEMYYCELSKPDMYRDHIRSEGWTDIKFVAQWMESQTDSFHRYCLKNYRIRHHANGISPKWEKIKRESDIIINEVESVFTASS